VKEEADMHRWGIFIFERCDDEQK